MSYGPFDIGGGSGGIPEAPTDGKGYVRKNAAWAEETGGSATGTAPTLQLSATEVTAVVGAPDKTVTLSTATSGAVTVTSSDDAIATASVSVDGKTITITGVAEGSAVITVSAAADGSNLAASAAIAVTVLRGYRYGFRIAKNDSNPATRVEYLHDAVGLTPATMNYTENRFYYGDWADKWFVTENKPLMLKNNGTVDYYLNPNNYDLKEDGTASDVGNTAYLGNAMAQIPLCWLKMWEDDDYEYVIISNVQWDETYTAYAHTRKDGTIADFFYYSMFDGSGNASKIRSLSGQTVAQSLTAANEIAGCCANGEKWYTHTWSQRTLITALLILMGKSTDTQSVFGNGNCRSASSNSGLIKTGTLKDKGQFFGFNTNTQAVKVFHIENFWGNQWDRTAGLINANGTIYAKMTPEGNGYRVTDTDGYENTGIAAPAGTNVYINKIRCGKYGFIPTAVSGSGSTYYCDCYCANNSQLDYLLAGASAFNATAFGGAFTFAVNHAPSIADWNIGCGLSCEMPAAA